MIIYMLRKTGRERVHFKFVLRKAMHTGRQYWNASLLIESLANYSFSLSSLFKDLISFLSNSSKDSKSTPSCIGVYAW